MTRDRLHSMRERERERFRLFERKRLLKEEMRIQDGPNDMHNDPDRVDRHIFDTIDSAVRTPDTIRVAEEMEAEAIAEERRKHRDDDFDVVDDIRMLERQTFEVI